MNSSRTQTRPIGLDIGSDSVKLLQLAVVDGSHLSVVAAACLPLPDEARQQPAGVRMPVAMDLVRRALRGSASGRSGAYLAGAFVGRDVVAALPGELVSVKNLRLPNMPVAELEAAVQFEAANVFPFDVTAAQIRYLLAGEVRIGSDVRQEVIALAAKTAEIDDFVEQLHRTGAVLSGLDFEPAALYRGVERYVRRRADEQEVHVLVDIGLRRTQVVIGRGREVNFYKPIEIGGHHLHEAVARKLGISVDEARSLRRRIVSADNVEAGDAIIGGAGVSEVNAPKRDPVRQAVFDATRGVAEELARELALCLRYYSVTFRGQRPARVRVGGGEGHDNQLIGILNASLPVTAETFRPLWSVDTSRMVAPGSAVARAGQAHSEWAVAFGLGLKGVTQTFGARDGARRTSVFPGDEARAAATGPAAQASSAGAYTMDYTSAMDAGGAPSIARSPSPTGAPSNTALSGATGAAAARTDRPAQQHPAEEAVRA